MPGRHRGFLTMGEDGDRNFLTGDHLPDETKQRWYDIRERAKAGFDDFEFLFEHLPAAQRKLVFELPRWSAGRGASTSTTRRSGSA